MEYWISLRRFVFTGIAMLTALVMLARRFGRNE